MWVDENSKVNMADAFSGIAQMQKQQSLQNAPQKGMMLETTWTDSKGVEKVLMRTHEFEVGKVDEKVFSTDGYEVIDMTTMPGFGR